MAKKFKPHMMYDAKKAETNKEHLKLKEMGYTHSPNKMRSSALKGMVNSPLTRKGPCWKGYEMFGMKDKGGRQVPNCVPKKKK